VVAAASGGIVDLVDDGVTGLLVAPRDPARLSAALATVVNDREAAAAMGRAALKRVRSFTASAVVGRVEGVYERLMAGLPPVN
jgi:glycosyltransferase involved in cell wall biosynthesis